MLENDNGREMGGTYMIYISIGMPSARIQSPDWPKRPPPLAVTKYINSKYINTKFINSKYINSIRANKAEYYPIKKWALLTRQREGFRALMKMI